MYDPNMGSQKSNKLSSKSFFHDLGSGVRKGKYQTNANFSIHSLISQGKFPHCKHVNREGRWEGN